MSFGICIQLISVSSFVHSEGGRRLFVLLRPLSAANHGTRQRLRDLHIINFRVLARFHNQSRNILYSQVTEKFFPPPPLPCLFTVWAEFTLFRGVFGPHLCRPVKYDFNLEVSCLVITQLQATHGKG